MQLLMGGKVNRFIPNPTFDPIIVPGCLDPLFRGQIPEGVEPGQPHAGRAAAGRVPRPRPAGDRWPRSRASGAELLFPTLGCGVEEALRHDIPATMASVTAFNRWLEEDWGFDYERRLIAVPMLSLADVDGACAEVDSLIERGARIVHVRPAPVPGPNGTGRSLGHKSHRPGVVAPGRGLDPGGLPPGRQRLQRLGRRRLGRERHLRGLRQHRRAQPDPGLGPGHPRHHRRAHHPRRVHPPPDAAGGQHRERLGLDGGAGQAPAQAGQPDAVGLPRRSRSTRSASTCGPPPTARRTCGPWPT